MDLLKKPSRRLFLLAAASVSGAAVAATAIRSAQHSPVPAPTSEGVRQRISEHARKYYRTTRI